MRDVQLFDSEVATWLQENRHFQVTGIECVVNAYFLENHMGLVQAREKSPINYVSSCVFLCWKAILCLAGMCSFSEPFVVVVSPVPCCEQLIFGSILIRNCSSALLKTSQRTQGAVEQLPENNKEQYITHAYLSIRKWFGL